MKVTDEHLSTVQLCTSKPDVRFKLSVLDNDNEVASVEAKGHAVLPVVIFLPNSTPEDDVIPHSTSQSCENYWPLVTVPVFNYKSIFLTFSCIFFL